MGLLSVICNHLVEGELALRRERALTREQKKLRRAAEERARLERDLREMELRLLQAQLNPHFLFNALNLIAGQAMLEDAPETSHLVGELSRLLRSSLSSIGKLVPLSEEVESARAYIEIFRARFERNVEFTVSLPESLAGAGVPALMLQPVIENSLRHAAGARDALAVKICAGEQDGCIRISVEDNGPGIPPGRLAEIKASLSSKDPEGKLTGLSGLNRRLKYYYPHMPDILVANLDSGLAITIFTPKE
jgi:sensor histidine kinase YesM